MLVHYRPIQRRSQVQVGTVLRWYEIFDFPSQDVQQKADLANQSVWLGLPSLLREAGVDQQS
jgi:hypothetical protein